MMFRQHSASVISVDDFLKKYGTMGMSTVIGYVIRELPDTESNEKLSQVLGIMVADLESALTHKQGH